MAARSRTDTERLDWMEKRHAYIWRNGYRGCWGFAIHEAAPGGHYREEDTRILGVGPTIRDAIDAAMGDA